MKWTYKKAGVDLEKGAQVVEAIKRAPFSTKVLGKIGDFAGFFPLEKEKYKEPVLVAATDGVGTKLKIAQALGEHETIGLDLVAMSVNDILTHGAKPLFFLDYIAADKIIVKNINQIIKGILEGCQEAGMILLGGETAEMPDFYQEDQYDLAGFAVGVAEKEKIIDGKVIKEGDTILGLVSSGLHSNGYSLVRKIFPEESFKKSFPQLKKTLAEELLKPTKIYANSILSLLENFEIHGLAHITGGGLPFNISRILPEGLGAFLKTSWGVPAIFKLIQEEGKVSSKEMYQAFNMGIGMVVILSPREREVAQKFLEEEGEKVYRIGEIKAGKGVILDIPKL